MAISNEERQIIQRWVDELGSQASLLGAVVTELKSYLDGGQLDRFPPDLRQMFMDGHLAEYVNEHYLNEDRLVEALKYGATDDFPPPDMSRCDFSRARYAVLRGVCDEVANQLRPYAVVDEPRRLLIAPDHLPSQADAQAQGAIVTPVVYALIAPGEAIDTFLTALHRECHRLSDLAEFINEEVVSAYIHNCFETADEQAAIDLFQKVVVRAVFLGGSRQVQQIGYMIGVVHQDRLDEPWLADMPNPHVGAIWLRDPEQAADDERDDVAALLRAWMDAETEANPA
jgi:hypothetical protein